MDKHTKIGVRPYFGTLKNFFCLNESPWWVEYVPEIFLSFIKFHFFGIMLFVMLWATKWYHICYIKVKVENFIEFKVPHFFVAEKLCDENCSTQHIPYGTLSGAYMQNFSPVGLKLMLACFTKVFVHKQTNTPTNGQTYKNRGETIQGAFGALKKLPNKN